MSEVRRFVGGPLCGTPVPAKAGTYLDLESGIYEDRGDCYMFRGPYMRCCPGCGCYVDLGPDKHIMSLTLTGVLPDCPLCGAPLAPERARSRPTMPPREPS